MTGANVGGGEGECSFVSIYFCYVVAKLFGGVAKLLLTAHCQYV